MPGKAGAQMTEAGGESGLGFPIVEDVILVRVAEFVTDVLEEWRLFDGGEDGRCDGIRFGDLVEGIGGGIFDFSGGAARPEHVDFNVAFANRKGPLHLVAGKIAAPANNFLALCAESGFDDDL